MKYILILIAMTQIVGCASASISQKLSFVSFEDKIKTTDLKSSGSIEGTDCTWYVGGYAIGMDPSVRNAFKNAAMQTEDSLIPGQEKKKKGDALKVIKNISVESGGFNAWIASRRCITVTGAGYQ